MKVSPEEENAIRGIERTINQKINEFQINYKSKDKLDCITMVLLSYAFDKLKSNSNSELGVIRDKVENLIELIG